MTTLVKDNKYPPETAGRLMVVNVPTALEEFTIGDARKVFYQNLNHFESINYLYVVDRDHHLKGVLSLKDFLRLPEATTLTKAITPRPVTAHPHTDQERVAYLAIKNNIKAIPVVDKDDKFLGIVPNDTIMTITFQEAHEDLMRLAGIHYPGSPDDILRLPIKTSMMHRLPWLVIGLIGGLLAAGIVNDFEEIIKQNLILAAFIPLIVYIADAVGTQIQAYFIRDIILDPDLKFSRYFSKQFLVTLLMGAIMGVGLTIISWVIYQQMTLALVLGLALLATVISSLTTGLLIPYLFNRFHYDPANGSGPIGTIIQDILSIFVYLTIATWIL